MENEKGHVLMPSIAKRFQCKGAACRYNCCRDWNITMSREEYRRWKKRGILPKGKSDGGTVCLAPEERRNGNTYAEIVLTEGGFCPYLTEEGLCYIQRDYGVREMTKTCKIFPRIFHSYFGHCEASFSLACERVLELLLDEREGIFLEEEKTQSVELYVNRYTIQDRRKYPKLHNYYDMQTLSIALLQAEDMVMENRLLLLGMAVDKIEAFYREGQEEQVSEYVAGFIKMAQGKEMTGLLQRFQEKRPLAVFNSVMSALLAIGFPEDFRNQMLWKAGKAIEQKKREKAENPELEYYRECREKFGQWIKGKEYFLENVMVMYLLWSNIPFKNLEKSLWENYLYFVWVYIILKGCLILYLTEESREEDMIDCCVLLFRKLGHNEITFTKMIDAYHTEGDTLAHVAILLRCL